MGNGLLRATLAAQGSAEGMCELAGCLAAGRTIVKGTPSWIHLGKGDSEMDMQLTPGKHRLSLQLGDDLHNTVKGLCSTITVNVTP